MKWRKGAAATGEIIKEVDLSALEEVSRSMLEKGVESIAVCFLHSYRNSDNETRVQQWLSKRWPGIPAVPFLESDSGIQRI